MANFELLDQIVKLYPSEGGRFEIAQEDSSPKHIDASISKVKAQCDREHALCKFFHEELTLLENAEQAANTKETREAAIASLIRQEILDRENVHKGIPTEQAAKPTGSSIAHKYRQSCCLNFVYSKRCSELSRLQQIKQNQDCTERGERERGESKKRSLDFHLV
jgi:hypothetical protein